MKGVSREGGDGQSQRPAAILNISVNVFNISVNVFNIRVNVFIVCANVFPLSLATLYGRTY